MSAEEKTGYGRPQLDFAGVVRHRFAFLASAGFSEIEALPTIVRYRRDDLDLNVYHGRQSYEVGLQVGHGHEQFSMSELIRAADPVAAEEYRNPAATTRAGLESGVQRLAELLQRYGERALRDDREFFVRLRKQRKSWADSYELDVLVSKSGRRLSRPSERVGTVKRRNFMRRSLRG